MSERNIWINFEAPHDLYVELNLEKMQQFDVLLKIFGRAIFEPVETKGGCLVKKANFEVDNVFRSKKTISIPTFFQKCL